MKAYYKKNPQKMKIKIIVFYLRTQNQNKDATSLALP